MRCSESPAPVTAPAVTIGVEHVPFYFSGGELLEATEPGDSGSPKALGFDDMGSDDETCRPAVKGTAQVEYI